MQNLTDIILVYHKRPDKTFRRVLEQSYSTKRLKENIEIRSKYQKTKTKRVKLDIRPDTSRTSNRGAASYK